MERSNSETISSYQTLHKFIRGLEGIFSNPIDQNNPSEIKTVDTSVKQLLRDLPLSITDLEPFHAWNPHRHSRILVYQGAQVSVILNCWEPQQKTPIHTHQESLSWSKILTGQLCFTVFNPKTKQPILQRQLTTGSVTTGGVELHQCSNLSERTVSLHIYSPPYTTCTSDEVVLPAVYCNYLMGQIEHRKNSLQQQLLHEQTIFSNFQTLTETLKQEIGPRPNVARVRKLLESFQIDRHEWTQYLHWDSHHYTRNLVAYDENFTLILLCWEPGQKSPIHDHAGSSCWVKVMEGELTEELFLMPSLDQKENEKPQPLSNTTLYPGSVAYIDDSLGIHRMGNSNPERGCVTLHCYAPPYHSCHIFDEKNSTRSKISFSAVNQLLLEEELRTSAQEYMMDSPTLLSGIQNLVDEMNQLFANCPSSEKPCSQRIQNLLKSFAFNQDEWKLYSHFSKHKYTRNLLYFNNKYSLMMNCWNLDQKTPPHDHKQSTSFTKMIMGELVCNQLDSLNQKVLQRIYYSEGSVHIMEASFGVHQMCNESNSTAISLHLYSPPYFECSSGTLSLPVVYCSSLYKCKESEKPNKLLDQYIQLQMNRTIYADFQSLVELLGESLKHKSNPEEVLTILRKFQIHEGEWRKYVVSDQRGYTRNLIAYDKNFTLMLMCWEPGQESPIHDHSGSDTWIKILAGAGLDDIHYEISPNKKPRVVQKISLMPDSASYNGKSIVHQTKNSSKSLCVALHLTSPPYQTCTCFDPKSGETSATVIEQLPWNLKTCENHH